MIMTFMNIAKKYTNTVTWEEVTLAEVLDMYLNHMVHSQGSKQLEVLEELFADPTTFYDTVEGMGIIPIRADDFDYDIFHDVEVEMVHLNTVRVSAVFIKDERIFLVVEEQENLDTLTALNLTTNELVDFIKDEWVPRILNVDYVKQTLQSSI